MSIIDRILTKDEIKRIEMWIYRGECNKECLEDLLSAEIPDSMYACQCTEGSPEYYQSLVEIQRLMRKSLREKEADHE